MLYFLLEEKEVDIKLAVAAGSMTTNLNVECSQRLSQSVVQCSMSSFNRCSNKYRKFR